MQSTRLYQICSRCILSTEDDSAIYFDEDGVCNHCHLYDKIITERIHPETERAQQLQKLVNEIKQAGKGKKYDCVIGVSGGVDSTYVAYLVKQVGLRPLAVHCDNGWNSELAVTNISKILKKLDIDLYTHVINWEEFRNLQLAYLKASVIDVEATSDHAILASLYEAASKFKIKYILSGENLVTEGILPQLWIHNKNDLINIKAIFKQFGSGKLKTYPTLGFLKKWCLENVKRIKYIRILDQIEYNKEEAKKIIAENLEWRDYGGKHYESIITRFYQSYILPKKFHVDKRRSHFSTMICSGQLSREEALLEIIKLPIEAKQLEEDKTYVLKKFGLSDSEFEKIISTPQKSHTDYPSIDNFLKKTKILQFVIKKILFNKKNKVDIIKSKGKKVAVLLDNLYINDKRVIQEARTISENFDITLFCVYSSDLPIKELKDRVVVERIFSTDIYRIWNRNLLKKYARRIASHNFDVIHCHDHIMLSLGVMIKKINPIGLNLVPAA